MKLALTRVLFAAAAVALLAAPGCAPETPAVTRTPVEPPPVTLTPTPAPTATPEPTPTRTPLPPVAATLTVTSTIWGESSAYIGAAEGSAALDLYDLLDLGINTYRIWGGASRWEWEDDDGEYGLPSIAQIKADPSVINWAWWDAAMEEPPQGSDYWWSGEPPDVWEGNARTLFQTLRDAGVRPVVTLRNVDNDGNPEWAWAMNPPETEEDRNEWWEHVFATVYWLNVRNDYRVDHWQIHNEPDHPDQGWGGDVYDYVEFARLTYDAIAAVYQAYLPGRWFHVMAPVTVEDSTWPRTLLLDAPGAFNAVDVHAYAADVSSYVRRVHGWMEETGAAGWPLWISEWGTWSAGAYEQVDLGVTNLIPNLIRGSQPGADHVDGSLVFALYDWEEHAFGLIDRETGPRACYYAMRLAIRGLQGARPTFQVESSSRHLLAIATRDEEGAVYLLVDNVGRTAFDVEADLSALVGEGEVAMWRYDLEHADVMVEPPVLEDGIVRFQVPRVGAVLIKIEAP